MVDTPKFTEHADAILGWVASGRSVTSYCEQHKLRLGTVWEWRQFDKEFDRKIALAREAGAEAMMDRAGPIADGTSRLIDPDTLQPYPESAVAVARDRLRLETLWKTMGFWAPARFGQKVDLSVSGQVALTDEERAERVQRIIAKAKQQRAAAKDKKK